MTDQYKPKLSELIDSSSLDDDQKLLWGLFLKESTPDENEAVYEAVSESSENLNILTKFLHDKIWEMKQRNKAIWEAILREEADYAAKL